LDTSTCGLRPLLAIRQMGLPDRRPAVGAHARRD
jgi:hypothetical protein